MSEPRPDHLTQLMLTILQRWRAGLQAEWEHTSSIRNPRNDLSRDIERIDAILSNRWQLTITQRGEEDQ